MTTIIEVKKEVDLTDVDTADLIMELTDRGHTVDADLCDFSCEEMYEHLEIEDVRDVDFHAMYQQIMSGNGELAFEEFKQIIQDRTGRIIV